MASVIDQVAVEHNRRASAMDPAATATQPPKEMETATTMEPPKAVESPLAMEPLMETAKPLETPFAMESPVAKDVQVIKLNLPPLPPHFNATQTSRPPPPLYITPPGLEWTRRAGTSPVRDAYIEAVVKLSGCGSIVLKPESKRSSFRIEMVSFTAGGDGRSLGVGVVGKGWERRAVIRVDRCLRDETIKVGCVLGKEVRFFVNNWCVWTTRGGGGVRVEREELGMKVLFLGVWEREGVKCW